MKSAYELAMERLNKQSPTVKLSEAQKSEIAEAEKVCKSKVAALELALKDEMNGFAEQQNLDGMYEAEQRFLGEKKKLETKLEEQREAIRARKR